MVMELVFTLVLGFLAAEVFVLIRWRGLWRWAALLPVLIVGVIVLWIVIEPARHYLLAFEVMIWSFLGLVILGILAGVRRLTEYVQSRRNR